MKRSNHLGSLHVPSCCCCCCGLLWIYSTFEAYWGGLWVQSEQVNTELHTSVFPSNCAGRGPVGSIFMFRTLTKLKADRRVNQTLRKCQGLFLLWADKYLKATSFNQSMWDLERDWQTPLFLRHQASGGGLVSWRGYMSDHWRHSDHRQQHPGNCWSALQRGTEGAVATWKDQW